MICAIFISRCRVNPPIREALAADALERSIGALDIIEPELGAMIPAEIKLSSVALQMRLADVVEGSIQATLEDSETGFDRICRNVVSSVFAGAMIDYAMFGKLATNFDIDPGFIRHQAGVSSDLRFEDGAKGGGRNVGDMERAFLAIALDQGNNLHFVLIPAIAFALFAGIAPVGFIDFDCTTVAAERRSAAVRHGFAQTMRHEPSGFIGHANRAVQLMGAHSLFAAANQERGKQPFMQGDLAALKHGADCNGEVLAAEAFSAAIQTGFAGLVGRSYRAAMRAYRAMWPQRCFKVFARCCVIVKARLVEVAHDSFSKGMNKLWARNVVVSSI